LGLRSEEAAGSEEMTNRRSRVSNNLSVADTDLSVHPQGSVSVVAWFEEELNLGLAPWTRRCQKPGKAPGMLTGLSHIKKCKKHERLHGGFYGIFDSTAVSVITDGISGW